MSTETDAPGQPARARAGTGDRQSRSGRTGDPGRVRDARGREGGDEDGCGAGNRIPADRSQGPTYAGGSDGTADRWSRPDRTDDPGGSRPLDPLDAGTGALVGATAYVAGFALVGLLTVIESPGSLALLGEIDESLAAEFPTTVGWLFYNAHFVGVGGYFLGLSHWVNHLTGSEYGTLVTVIELIPGESVSGPERSPVPSTVPLPGWIAAPVVVLVSAGYLVGRRAEETDPIRAATAGASIVVGYLALTVAGTEFFTTSSASGELETVIGPQLTASIVIVGITYPLVFGGLGGALAARLDGRADAGAPTDG